MKQLLIANFIWAFSFSFIGQYVSGKIDTYFGIFLRLSLGFLFWLPFIRLNKITKSLSLKCLLIGMIQVGFMYLAYYNSFTYLKVTEVALFTITTPLYLSIFSNFLEQKIDWHSILAAMIATTGACIIRWSTITSDFMLGFLFVQIANCCFALGQILYRKHLATEKQEKSFFAFFYLGAIIPLLPFLFFRFEKLTLQMPMSTALTLIWLGLVASGFAYYLWNSSTMDVSVAQLAVLNNIVVPMAILVNLVLWSGQVQWLSFLIGSFVIIFSLYLGGKNNITRFPKS